MKEVVYALIGEETVDGPVRSGAFAECDDERLYWDIAYEKLYLID